MKKSWIIMLSGTSLILAACSNGPDQKTLQLPGKGEVQHAVTSYDCKFENSGSDAGQVSVTYLNNDDTALAVAKFPGDSSETLLVNVVSGSGAKYVGNVWEWWNQGETATLTNGIDAEHSMDCTEHK